jgi:hypothetical protein
MIVRAFEVLSEMFSILLPVNNGQAKVQPVSGQAVDGEAYYKKASE